MNNNRVEQIYKLLQIHEQVSVQDLADLMQVTKTTIRRDLLLMEEKGLVRRRRGYALLPTRDLLTRFNSSDLFQEEKMRIAKKAVRYVTSNTSLALDSGSSVAALVKCLKDDPTIQGLDIVTSSLDIAIATCEQYRVAIPGGFVLAGEQCVGGVDVTDFFHKIHADLVFLGSTGVSNSSGLTVSYPLMCSVKEALVGCATTRIALLDSSKYHSRGLYTFCDFDALDVLITVENEENAPVLEKIARHHVEIVLV
ncbi:DeoR/GlpR transcriptional regulator [Anaerofilum sp. BX8]|uniref:DeoR/GlpR transcriptional regulator n=1 Tax=Anaerofilum hominis TaxID=2763016 RepID=A0A923I8N2_9FIRM|nr:DeoR/GlpR family DNA-binding transcription regulator [Anaerofilum hominis]MBC5580288.1 DeoR/GlpR transcriptional regulator [Anaerofilum hominis]